MTKAKMTIAQAFDEWMREYERNPEGFLNEMQAVQSSHRKAAKRKESDYGVTCEQLLKDLLKHGKAAWKVRAKRKA